MHAQSVYKYTQAKHLYMKKKKKTYILEVKQEVKGQPSGTANLDENQNWHALEHKALTKVLYKKLKFQQSVKSRSSPLPVTPILVLDPFPP